MVAKDLVLCNKLSNFLGPKLYGYISKYHLKNIYSENKYLLNTHISYDKLLLTRKLLDLRLI